MLPPPILMQLSTERCFTFVRCHGVNLTCTSSCKHHHTFVAARLSSTVVIIPSLRRWVCMSLINTLYESCCTNFSHSLGMVFLHDLYLQTLSNSQRKCGMPLLEPIHPTSTRYASCERCVSLLSYFGNLQTELTQRKRMPKLRHSEEVATNSSSSFMVKMPLFTLFLDFILP